MDTISAMGNKFMESRLPRAMEALGIQSAASISVSLDTAYPPASLPGEAPHKRTGNLRAGVDYRTFSDGNDFYCVVSSSRAQGDPDVPVFLEFGTWKMEARPYMRPEMFSYVNTSRLPLAMTRAFSSEATYAAAG